MEGNEVEGEEEVEEEESVVKIWFLKITNELKIKNIFIFKKSFMNLIIKS